MDMDEKIKRYGTNAHDINIQEFDQLSEKLKNAVKDILDNQRLSWELQTIYDKETDSITFLINLI